MFPERTGSPWEVYAFEASPLIQPYLDKFLLWLNGKGCKPPVTVPPSGSTVHLSNLAERFGCPHSASKFDEMRECMWKTFAVQLEKIDKGRDPSLNEIGLIRSRLQQAGHPPATPRDRYTLIPAAVSNKNGTLNLGTVNAKQMIRGGARTLDEGKAKDTSVPVVDVVTWISLNFKEEDFVFLKVDVEGAEFAILQGLLDIGKFGLIDALYLECHPLLKMGSCPELEARLRAAAAITGAKFMKEDRHNLGWDSCSTPSLYYPEDPLVLSGK